jgi:hypothetical protein
MVAKTAYIVVGGHPLCKSRFVTPMYKQFNDAIFFVHYMVLILGFAQTNNWQQQNTSHLLAVSTAMWMRPCNAVPITQ